MPLDVELTARATERLRQNGFQVDVLAPLVLRVHSAAHTTILRLHNLAWAVGRAPDTLESRLDQLLAAVGPKGETGSAPLVPVLRPVDALPASAPRWPLGDSGLVWALAEDGRETRRLLRQVDCDLRRRTPRALFDLARSTLAGRAGQVDPGGDPPVWRVRLDGDLDSSLLLLDSLWEGLVDGLNARGPAWPLLACAPARGALLLAHGPHVGKLLAAARSVRLAEPWPLRCPVLERRAGHWVATPSPPTSAPVGS